MLPLVYTGAVSMYDTYVQTRSRNLKKRVEFTLGDICMQTVSIIFKDKAANVQNFLQFLSFFRF